MPESFNVACDICHDTLDILVLTSNIILQVRRTYHTLHYFNCLINDFASFQVAWRCGCDPLELMSPQLWFILAFYALKESMSMFLSKCLWSSCKSLASPDLGIVSSCTVLCIKVFDYRYMYCVWFAVSYCALLSFMATLCTVSCDRNQMLFCLH